MGFLYAYLFYRKENKLADVVQWVKRTMFAFRLLTVTILCFLLLTPLIKTVFNKIEKPLIVFVQDNSASILMNKDSGYYQNEYPIQIEKLKEKIAENYEVKSYTFSEELNDNFKVDFKGKVTNLSSVFSDIENRFYNQNIGAIVLASDGIFNQGANPNYTSQTNGVPVYAIALGDTNAQKDVLIKGVTSNKITFLGNKFPVEITGLFQQVQGNEVELKIVQENNTVFSKVFKVEDEKVFIDENVLLEAKNVGTQHYKILLSKIENEISYVNNSKDFYIDVLDGRQEVLILSSAPHPDIKALKLSIENNENYKVTTQFLKDFNENIDKYSLVILHQFPSESAIFNQLSQKEISVWYILNPSSDISKFNTLQAGLTIEGYKGQSNDVFADVNAQFPLFTLSVKATKFINETPPLLSVFGTFKENQTGYSLLHQKIRNVKTDSPLMVFYQNEKQKVAVLAGEGIWRWRMEEYKQFKNHDSFDELVNKTVQFLSVKSDKSRFRLALKNSILENEEVIINAELYNESYELINEPEINIEIKNKEGEAYNYVFNKTSNSYFLNAGIFTPGSYQYKAIVKIGEKVFSEQGVFEVEKILLESNNTVANHQLLKNLSLKHGGQFFLPKNMMDIANQIEKNNNIASIIYEEKDLKEIINIKWIFSIILLLLSVEWFLRKRNGAY